MTRLELQSLPTEEIVATGTNLNKVRTITTSGSCGIPLVVFIRKNDNDFYDMIWARTSLANGRTPWDRTVYWKFHFPPKHWFERLGIWKKEIISLVDDQEKQIAAVRRIKPDIVRGNTFQLVNLATTIRQRGIEDIRPRLVFTMGSLLDRQSRELIQSAFGAEIFDCYGATELGCIAWECSEHRGYHLNIDSVVVEFITEGRPANPGEMGKIVCTGLHSFAMPFIRYDLGDVGIPTDEPCPCGRGLPLMKRVEGRADDFFICEDGTHVSPSVIVNQIKMVPGISQFQFIQHSVNDVRAQIVPSKTFSQDTSAAIKKTMQHIMGNDVNIQVDICDAIRRDPSGKIRSLVSKVDRQL